MKIDDSIIKLLLKLADKAYRKGEIPVSAIIIDSNGKVISHSYNNRQKKYNVLGHAEILAILKAEKMIRDWRLDGYSMVVLLEPCDMCSMVISKSRLDHVYYLIPQRNDEVKSSCLIGKSEIDGYELEKKIANDLLLKFFNNMR